MVPNKYTERGGRWRVRHSRCIAYLRAMYNVSDGQPRRVLVALNGRCVALELDDFWVNASAAAA